MALNCDVLRCNGTGAELASKVSPMGREYGNWEGWVCADHASQIAAGEPWEFYDERSIAMGADLPPQQRQ